MSMNRSHHSTPQHHSDEKDGYVRSIAWIMFSGRFKSAGICGAIFFAFAIQIANLSAFAQNPTKPRAEGNKKPAESRVEQIDSEKLPAGYLSPPEKLSIFDLDQPIATKEEMDRWKKESADFFRTKNYGDLTPAGQKIIESKIRYLLAEMTLKEKLYELPKLRKTFFEQVGQQAKQPAVTQFIGETVLKYIPELLKNQYHVRLQAVEILGEMDFAPSYELLIHVLQAKDIREDEVDGQPESMKVAAVKSLTRILRFAESQPKDRLAIALAVAAELEKPDLHWWLQLRLVDALRYADITGIDTRNSDKPFVVDALLAVVKDEKRNFRVRTRACYALGRVPFPRGSVKTEDIVTAITDCALQVSNAAAANPGDPEWKNCIWNIYLAFHKGGTKNDPDLDAEKKPMSGLLDRVKTVAQPAYQVIVPIVNDIMSDKAPDAGNLRNLSAFARSRQS